MDTGGALCCQLKYSGVHQTRLKTDNNDPPRTQEHMKFLHPVFLNWVKDIF